MKPILFIVFLALGPAIGAQVTPTLAKVQPVHAVVGDVEQLPDRDDGRDVGRDRLRGHDSMAARDSVEEAR